LGVAAPGTRRYVELAGSVALLVGGLLLLARLLRLGFLANFLSRTVLVGFLTGVGVQVAVGQLPELLGVPSVGGSTATKVWHLLRGTSHLQVLTMLVSMAVIAAVIGVRLLTRRVPGALLAVVASIVAEHMLDLRSRGVEVLGPVEAGLPQLALPSLAEHDLVALLPIAVSMSVVILAQSAATSRAYAARYDEHVDTDTDLTALGAANLAASATGTFVVNGSPTKTEMVDNAGGRSQVASLAASVVVLVVLLVLTRPLAGLPLAALAAVVFLIGIELVDLPGMRRIYLMRRGEFVVALLTAAAVVLVGVEQGIVLAIVASIVDHLRHSYCPYNSVLEKSPAGHWRPTPVTPGARTVEGLVVYRFGTSLYFANASRFADDVTALISSGGPVSWFCIDGAAIGDVDYSAAMVLARVRERLQAAGIRLVLSSIIDPVGVQFDRYGLSVQLTPDRFFDTSGEVLAAYQALRRPDGNGDDHQ
ncbi:MAG: SulP family inorganic anion transporter, partial [Actinomycetota bacterium]|nr:SulP family inorganic anion transporter [Actinomycetota bacterium]